MTSTTEGGMRMPSVPPAASVAVASAARIVASAHLGKRHLRHGGGGRDRRAADRAEGRAGEHRRPSRCRRGNARSASSPNANSDRDSPPCVANWPISRNSGITDRSYTEKRAKSAPFEVVEQRGFARQRRRSRSRRARTSRWRSAPATPSGHSIAPNSSNPIPRLVTGVATRSPVERREGDERGERDAGQHRRAYVHHVGMPQDRRASRRSCPHRLRGRRRCARRSSSITSREQERAERVEARLGPSDSSSRVKKSTMMLARLSWQYGRHSATNTAQPVCTSS